MQRIVSIWLPLWPIERMRRADRSLRLSSVRGEASSPHARAPFALVESGRAGLTLAAVDERAQREGLYPGQALADARAAVPGLLTHPAERDRDRAALRALAAWCGRYGPRRNCHDARGHCESGIPGQDDPKTDIRDGIWIDITGVAHLFGGEPRLLADLARHLDRFGVTARLGLADTFGAAFAAARFATICGRAGRASWALIPPDGTREALAGLPADALRLPPDCVVLLKRLGLRRIGQLYDLPRESLAQRFRTGPSRAGGKGTKRAREIAQLAGAVLLRLDQTLGTICEPLLPLETPPLRIVRQAFAEPLLSSEGVTTSIAMLAADLCQRLASDGQGGTRFTLGLYRSDGTAAHLTVATSSPCREAGHLIGLLSEKIATFDAGFGVDVMTLAATRFERRAADQIALPSLRPATDLGTGTADSVTPLIDRLTNRLGAPRVLRLSAGDSHIPERAEERRPALSTPRSAGSGWACATPGRRPAFLFAAPEPILVTAEVPDGPPLHFAWRRLNRRVLRAQGPERIEPEWWRAIGPQSTDYRSLQQARPRDYYAIEAIDGGRYWVYRAGLYGGDDEHDEERAPPVWFLPVWFLHGVFA